MKHRFTLAAVSLLCLLFVIQSQAVGQCASLACTQTDIMIGDDQIELICVKYDYPNPGESTWFYKVTSGSAPAISHVDWELNLSCLSVTGWGTWGSTTDTLQPGVGLATTGHDPTTGVTGIKFDLEFTDGEMRGYYFTVDGNYDHEDNIVIASKGGPSFDSGLICGPSSTCESIDACPPCEPPTGITITQVAPRSYLISWDDNDCAMGWQICGMLVGGTDPYNCHRRVDTFKQFYNLIPGETYAFKIRTGCLDTTLSAFTSVYTFTVPPLRLGGEPTAVALHPNPTTDNVQIDMTSDRSEAVRIRVLDMSGAVVYSNAIRLDAGTTSHVVDVSGLAEGLHIVQIHRNDGVESHTFTVTR